MILDKKNVYDIPNFYNHNVLYDVLASKLAENIKIDSPTTVIVDKSKNKQEEIINFNERFILGLDNNNNHSININHVNSINYKGLQIADLVSWAVFQNLEHGNSEFMELIKNKTIMEVFKK